MIAGLAIWPGTASALLACDDPANAVTVDLSDPGLTAKFSAGYHDVAGPGDQFRYRFTGTDAGGPTFASGLCTNDDVNWTSLEVILPNGDDRARLDAKRPAVEAPSAKIPAFVEVTIYGKNGADNIRGHGGFDALSGGKGNDRINVAGAGGDAVLCGGGHKDVAIVGEGDGDVTSKCEKVIER